VIAAVIHGLLYSDWLTHQNRDTCASIVGHFPLTSYLAIADNEAIGRTKFEMIEVSSEKSFWTLVSELLTLYMLAENAPTLWASSGEG
jgi:hypothetical protein